MRCGCPGQRQALPPFVLPPLHARWARATALAVLIASPAYAQGTAPTAPPERGVRRVMPALGTATPPPATLVCSQPPENELGALSDEFSGAATVAADGRWHWFHERNGWPTMLRRADVNATAAGELYMEPALSGWFADNHAPFLFQTVTGDFDVTTRVRSAPASGGDSLPRATWSLVGLMARVPSSATPANWAPFRENWLFITTGTAEAPGVPVFETKSTVNSGSNLKLRPARAGWVELRMVRLRETFLLLSRLPGETWQVRERVLRRDVPSTMQIGIRRRVMVRMLRLPGATRARTTVRTASRGPVPGGRTSAPASTMCAFAAHRCSSALRQIGWWTMKCARKRSCSSLNAARGSGNQASIARLIAGACVEGRTFGCPLRPFSTLFASSAIGQLPEVRRHPRLSQRRKTASRQLVGSWWALGPGSGLWLMRKHADPNQSLELATSLAVPGRERADHAVPQASRMQLPTRPERAGR